MKGTYTETLPCQLTNGEVMQRGQDAGRAQLERDIREGTRVDEQKQAKREIEVLEAKIHKLLTEARTRTEHREVEVVDREDLTNDVMDTVRIDTGETVRQRPLRPDERQTRLFEISGKAATGDDAPKGDGGTDDAEPSAAPGS